jgi:hypothetical protein
MLSAPEKLIKESRLWSYSSALGDFPSFQSHTPGDKEPGAHQLKFADHQD